MIEENKAGEDNGDKGERGKDQGGGDGSGVDKSKASPLEEKSRALSGDPARDDRNAVSSQEVALLVGSITSKKYHRPDCRYAGKIKPENLVSFASVEDARAEGYLSCKVCNT